MSTLNSRQRRKLEAEQHNAAYEESKKRKPSPRRSGRNSKILGAVMASTLALGADMKGCHGR